MTLIRLAEELDTEQMLKIYTPIIQDTTTSFELLVPSLEQFGSRVSKIMERFPWLVCELDGIIAGYAYAGAHRSREAYQWSTELSVYIRPEYHRKNIARAMYLVLFDSLRLMGYYTALAGITLPNDASVKFHEKLGFTPVGVYSNVGYKFGSWQSVGWWEFALQEYNNQPTALKKLQEVYKTRQWMEILENASQLIKS